MSPEITDFESLSKGKTYRVRKCKVAEALAEYEARGDDQGKAVLEQALESPKITDNAIRVVLQDDGIEAFKDAAGPQSVTFHRSQKACICYTGDSAKPAPATSPASLGLVGKEGDE